MGEGETIGLKRVSLGKHYEKSGVIPNPLLPVSMDSI